MILKLSASPLPPTLYHQLQARRLAVDRILAALRQLYLRGWLYAVQLEVIALFLHLADADK